MNWPKFFSRFILGLMIVAGVELSLFAIKSNQAASDQLVSPQAQQPSFTVQHQVKGNDLHLQLTVQKFTFSIENMGKENKFGEGHVHLYIDGKKVAKIFEPQYVYSDLPKGNHQVTLELAHNNHESYGVKQSFEIQVK